MSTEGGLWFPELQDVANKCNVELIVIARNGAACFPAGAVSARSSVVVSMARPEQLDQLLAEFESLLITDAAMGRGSVWRRATGPLVVRLAIGVQRHVEETMGLEPGATRIMPVEPETFDSWVREESIRRWVAGHHTRIGRYHPRSGPAGFAFTTDEMG